MVIQKIIKKIKGFTVVEILVILTLIGSLSAFSVVSGQVQFKKARDASRKIHLDEIKKSIEEYYQDTNCYPQTIPSCQNSLQSGELVILDNIPCDPKSKLSYTYVPEVSECPNWYQIYANIEFTDDKVIDKIGCREGCGPNCQFNYGVSSVNQKLNPFCNETPPNPEALPTPIPEIQSQYVCSPGGACEVYNNPEISGCPDVYLNDPLCQDACSDKKNQCHDARGKK